MPRVRTPLRSARPKLTALFISISWGLVCSGPVTAQTACIQQCLDEFANCEDSFPICRAERDQCIKACKATNDEPAHFTLRLSIVPAADTGRFNLRVDNKTVATDKQNGDAVGPLSLVPGLHTVSQTAGSDTDLDDYRTTACG